jgi:hypothetical protein
MRRPPLLRLPFWTVAGALLVGALLWLATMARCAAWLLGGAR